MKADPRLKEWLRADQSQVFRPAPSFPKLEVFRLMGGGNGRLGTRQTVRKVNSWTKRLAEIAEPRMVFSVFRLDGASIAGIRLEDGTFLRSAKLGRTLKDCDAVACFVGTLGVEVDEEINRLTCRNKLSDAFIVDAAASAGAEQLVDEFHKGMAKMFRSRGKGATLRFSPGYCDWAVTEQAKLFSLLETDLIGVELSESSLMNPRKSVSGVFGLTSSPSSVSARYNPCAHCGKKDCVARRPI